MSNYKKYERMECESCEEYTIHYKGDCMRCDGSENRVFAEHVQRLRDYVRHQQENRGKDLFEEFQNINKFYNRTF